jgi:hypothetical protein
MDLRTTYGFSSGNLLDAYADENYIRKKKQKNDVQDEEDILRCC